MNVNMKVYCFCPCVAQLPPFIKILVMTSRAGWAAGLHTQWHSSDSSCHLVLSTIDGAPSVWTAAGGHKPMQLGLGQTVSTSLPSAVVLDFRYPCLSTAVGTFHLLPAAVGQKITM